MAKVKNRSNGKAVYTIPEFLLESQRKYIVKLEEENTQLKEALNKKNI